MKNAETNPHVPAPALAIDRRRFLQSAVGASLALPAPRAAQTPRPIAPDALIRVGLIGRDGHSEILLGSIPKLSHVRWTAYAKSDPKEDSAWVQKQFPSSSQTRVYEDYHAMLEKEPLDVVGVCLPYFQNAEASIQAARKGIHVLSEKPAALNLPDLTRLEGEIRQSGVRYSIMLAIRALPIFQAARKAVQEGAIGEPILLSSQKSYQFGSERPWYYKERKTYGGTIPWVGIHALDYMRWVSGQEYAQVAAYEGNKAHPQTPGCEDHAGLLFRLVNGGTATCHLDFLRPARAPSHGDDRLRIAGSEGVLEVGDVENRARLISAKGRTGELPLPAPVNFFGTFIAELRGEGKHIVSAEDAFAITRICLMAREAADAGSCVKLYTS
jgi:predicted dehydrogenase